jgi:hypothetical protein
MMLAVAGYSVDSPGFLAFTMSESLTILPKTVALFSRGYVKPTEDMESKWKVLAGPHEDGELH